MPCAVGDELALRVWPVEGWKDEAPQRAQGTRKRRREDAPVADVLVQVGQREGGAAPEISLL